MSYDGHINFGYTTVLIAPTPADSGTNLTLATGGGALMPSVPFNATVWPSGTGPLLSNAEIVRVTDVTGDVVTFTRAQEGTSAKSIAVGWQFANSITTKIITDLETAIDALPTSAIQSISAGTAIASGSQVVFADGNGVTFGITGNTLTASISTGGGGGAAISAGGASQNTGTIIFSNSNGVSFGLNAGTLTATVATNYQSQGAYLTTAMLSNAATISNINFSAGTTSQNLSKLTFADSNGISFGLNGSVVTATVATNYQSAGAYLTTARASNDAIGLNTALTANGVSVTANSSGLSLNFPAFLTTAMASNAATISNINFSAGTTSQNLSKLTFADSNGVSFGLNGSVVTATVQTNYLTTARASTDAIGLNTALTANGVSVTANSSGLSLNFPAFLTTAMLSNAATISNVKISAGTTSNNMSALTFDNAGGISFGLNGSVITAAAPAGAPSPVNFSAGTTSNNLGSVVFSNSNNVSFGLNGSTMTVSFNPINIGMSTNGNTAGTTGTFDGAGLEYVFVGHRGIQLSQSSNGSSVSLSIGGLAVQEFSPPWAFSGMATNSSLGHRTLYFQPFDVLHPIVASRINFYMSLSGALSAGNSTGTCYVSAGYALYTRNPNGTDSRSIILSTSYAMPVLSLSMTSNTAYGATWADGLVNVSSHTTAVTGISATNASTHLATNINGARRIVFPGFNMVLNPDRYWLGFSVSTVTGNAMTNNVSAMITSVGVQPAFGNLGNASLATNASSLGRMAGWGSYSATSAAWPASINLITDDIRQAAAANTLIHFDIKGYSYSSNVI